MITSIKHPPSSFQCEDVLSRVMVYSPEFIARVAPMDTQLLCEDLREAIVALASLFAGLLLKTGLLIDIDWKNQLWWYTDHDK